ITKLPHQRDNEWSARPRHGCARAEPVLLACNEQRRTLAMPPHVFSPVRYADPEQSNKTSEFRDTTRDKRLDRAGARTIGTANLARRHISRPSAEARCGRPGANRPRASASVAAQR